MTTTWKVGAPNRPIFARGKTLDRSVSGTSGAEEYDCIVDNSLASSSPIADTPSTGIPQYIGVTEALNDFAASGRLRCWMLIEPSATRYDDTAVTPVLTGLVDVKMVGHVSGLDSVLTWDGSGDVEVEGTTGRVVWKPKGSTTNYWQTFAYWRMENLVVDVYNKNVAGFLNFKPTYEMVMLDVAWVGNLAASLGGDTVAIDSAYLYAERCTFGMEDLDLGLTSKGCYCLGCEWEIRGTGSQAASNFTLGGTGISVFTGSAISWKNSRFRFTGGDTYLDIRAAYSGRTDSLRGVTLTDASTTLYLDLIGGRIYGRIANFTSVVVATDFQGFINAPLNSSNNGYALTVSGGDVDFSALNVGHMALSGGTGHVTAEVHTAAISGGGPWDITLERGESASNATTQFLLLSTVDGCNIRVHATPSAGAVKPYTIAAGADRNIIIFPRAGQWAAAGTDAGTSNRIITEVTDTYTDSHITDSSAAHNASAVAYAGSAGLSATDVEAALDELDTEKISSITIEDEGVSQGAITVINFVGSGVTAAVAAGEATVTISAGGGGLSTVIDDPIYRTRAW